MGFTCYFFVYLLHLVLRYACFITYFFKDFIYTFSFFYVFLANYVGVTSASIPKPSLTYENEVLFPDSPGMPELHSVFNSSSSVVVSKGFVWVSHCSRIWEKSARNFPLKNASKFSTFFWNRTIQISYNFGFVTGDRLKLLSMAFISTLFFLF